jgi:hypothetical protein
MLHVVAAGGFFKLWLTGRFDDVGYERPRFDADQDDKAVEDAGGYIKMHRGSHAERSLRGSIWRPWLATSPPTGRSSLSNFRRWWQRCGDSKGAEGTVA